MIKLTQLIKFLNRFLKVRSYPENRKNGLVLMGRKSITKIGFAVSPSLDIFRKADRADCGLIITHHGPKQDELKGKLWTARLNFLRSRKISYAVYHLPLDGNEKVGNNIALLNLLGLRSVMRFSYAGKAPVGYIGAFLKPVDRFVLFKQICRRINKRARIFAGGPNKTKRVGVVSGNGLPFLEEAVKQKIDSYITGEPDDNVKDLARELKLNIFILGHDPSERYGLLSLKRLITQRSNISGEFIN